MTFSDECKILCVHRLMGDPHLYICADFIIHQNLWGMAQWSSALPSYIMDPVASSLVFVQ